MAAIQDLLTLSDLGLSPTRRPEDVARAPARPTTMQRILLAITTGPFRPHRRLSKPYVALFVELEQNGWVFREVCPRYHACWNNSALIQESAARVAILPDTACGLSSLEHLAFVHSELFRRVARVNLVEIGQSPDIVDDAVVRQHLLEIVAEHVLGNASARSWCAELITRAEQSILEAATGWRGAGSGRFTADVPPHSIH